jgi:hypothetical protein
MPDQVKHPPPNAPRSEDGYYWWDQDGNNGEGQWQLIPQPGSGSQPGGKQGEHQGGTQKNHQGQDGQHSIQPDINQFPALWRLSQVHSDSDGVTTYLSQLGIDVSGITWEPQSVRDNFYTAVPVATNAIYRFVTELMTGTNGVSPHTALTAVEAMNQVVTNGDPVRDFLYSNNHGTESDQLRQEMEQLQVEANWIDNAVRSGQ